VMTARLQQQLLRHFLENNFIKERYKQ